MNLPAPFLPRSGRPQRGAGLIQVLLVLLLVGGITVLASQWLGAQRQLEPVLRQQQALRWADEAVAAFAARHARLPCPAAQANGTEACLADGRKRQQGWLPTASLQPPDTDLAGMTALAYLVQRSPDGAPEQDIDLTAPANLYHPHGLLGEPRAEQTDENGTTVARFDAINGLDLCLAIASLQTAPADTGRAHVGRGDQARNVAYALAVAGPHGGSGHLPGRADASGGFPLPGTEPDPGQDRVQARSFASLAQAVGCRTPVDATTTPYSDALAGLDALAMAVAMHDSALVVKDNNVGNAELQLNDAIAAEVFAMTDILLTISELVGTTSSMILAAAQLIESTATCIASLGTLCWRVPIQATAVAFEGLSAIANSAALANQIAALGMASHALSVTLDARNRANRAAQPPPQDVESAIADLTLQLHGGKQVAGCNVTASINEATGEVTLVYENDCDKSPDPDQQVDTPGLYAEAEEAEKIHRRMQQQLQLHQQYRITPFADGRIAGRIDQTASMNPTLFARPYRRCDHLGTGNGHYSDAGCSNSTDTGNGTPYGWVFDSPRATADAIAKRTATERWVDTYLRLEQDREQLQQQKKVQQQWFGKGGLLELMRNDASDICRRANNPDLEPQARQELADRCASSNDGVRMIEHCQMPAIDQATGQLVYQEMTDPDAMCKARIQERVAALESAVAGGEAALAARKQAYDRQPAPVMRYPAGWFQQLVAQDAQGNFILKTQSKPFYAPEPYDCPQWQTCSAPLLVTGRLDFGALMGQLVPERFGTLATRYPYHRGYMDWLNARAAAATAEQAWTNLLTQIDSSERMLAELIDQALRGDSGVGNRNLAIGAPAILQLADQRGSLGNTP